MRPVRCLLPLPLWRVLSTVCVALSISAYAQHSAGDMDPAFGTNGILKLYIAERSSSLPVLIPRPDGGLLVVSLLATEPNLLVVALRPDGTLDTSFGPNGRRVLVIGAQPNDTLRLFHRYTDARVLVAFGSRLARITPQGVLDASFGSGGVIAVPAGLAGAAEFPGALIVARGDGILSRMLDNGTFDPAWQAILPGAFRGPILRSGENTTLAVYSVVLFPPLQSPAYAVVSLAGGVEPADGILEGGCVSRRVSGVICASGFGFVERSSRARLVRTSPSVGQDAFAMAFDESSDGTLTVLVYEGNTAPNSRAAYSLQRFAADWSRDASYGVAGRRLLASTLNPAAFAVQLVRAGDAHYVMFEDNGTESTLARVFNTAEADITPDAFEIPAQSNVPPGAVATSSAVTIRGITAPIALTVSNGEVSLGCTGTFSSTAITVSEGSTFCVRHTTPVASLATTTTTVTAGGVTRTFTSTTQEIDDTPDAFEFTTQSNVLPATLVTSAPVTVRGINVPVEVSVTDGEISVGCSGSFTATPQSIASGQSLCVRHRAPLALGASFSTTVRVGRQTRIFVSITQAALDPDADFDADGIPNGLELALGHRPFVKDNDIFADAALFTQQQFRDFFGREADAAGLAYWRGRIETGALARVGLVFAFFTSGEYENGMLAIARLYHASFGRPPERDGWLYWTNRARQGLPRTDMAGAFIASEEFRSRYGNLGNAAFVGQLYRNVLGREPDGAGLQYWADRLDGGIQSRGELLMQFADSAEFVQKTLTDATVRAAFVTLLARDGAEAEITYWANQFERVKSSQGIEAARRVLLSDFLGAAEYRARFLP